MADEWPTVALGAILSQVQRSESVKALESVPYAGVRWYAQGVYPRAEADASGVKAKRLNRLVSGDVTYNRMWATKAAFGVVGPDSDGCLVTNDFPIFVPIGPVLPDYMALVFQTRTFQKQAALFAVGTTERKRLREADFLRLVVSLPPLDVQRRIVNVVMHLDQHLDRLRDEVRSAERLWERLLPLPDSAELVPLGQLLESIDAGRSPSGEERRPETHERAVLKVSAVARNRFCSDEVKTVSAETVLPPSSRISNRDVLMVRANGVLDRVGQVCLVDRDYENLFLCDKTLRLMPKETLDQGYLAYALLAPHAREQIRSLTGGSQMRNIGQAAIRQIRIPVPHVDVQHRIAALVETAVVHARALDSEASRLEGIRATMLPRLLSGEIENPRPHDMHTGEVE